MGVTQRLRFSFPYHASLDSQRLWVSRLWTLVSIWSFSALEVSPTSCCVSIKHGTVYANSRDVAEFFGKEHKNVLRDIDAVLENLHGSDLSDGWFRETDVLHPTVYGRLIRAFDMTRDGFTILIMGYTGPKAMEFKVRYIQQFNAMEETLKAPHHAGRGAADVSAHH